ncbi:MAG: vanomycin resistance protein VanB [Oscillochloris sp.]|nr:vanomycin resistance protein VanB [Oscillochloris sp.]
MHRMVAIVFVAVLLAVVSLPVAPAVAAPQSQQSEAFVYFPNTGHNIGFEIKQFFDANGGLAIFGYPLTELIVGADGMAVQYFERARLEYHAAAPAGRRVLASRAGAILTADRTAEPAFQWLAASPDPARDFFPESGHTLGGAFRWFWQTRGGLAVFGYPISEEFYELNSADGNSYLVQYFERARFEYHPEHAGQSNEVTLGFLGQQLIERDPVALAATAPVAPITLLGNASTGFNTSSTDRVTNIARATEMVHGAIIAPGAEFSFAALGDFSAANGFVDGYAIVGGRLETVIGGGLCQVSTTLFRAVSNSGLQVTRRIGHSHIVYFYENILGFDATVYIPGVDFRWRNDTASPVYVVGRVDRAAARLTFELYGVSDGRKARHEGPFTKNWKQPGAPVWQYDKTLPRGAVRQLVHGRSGVDVTYYRYITFGDGTTRRDTYFTRYTPWEDFFIYGPGVTPPAGAVIIPPR